MATGAAMGRPSLTRPALTGPGKPAAPAPMGGRRVSFGKIDKPTGQRIGIFGAGGIGKTTLACTAPGPVAVFDLDGSLSVLAPKLAGLDVRPLSGIATWQDILDAVRGEGWDEIKTIVIDTLTRGEELAVADTLENVPHPDKNCKVDRIENYGYGKGYTYAYETFLPLLADLDRHVAAGRNVILVCHDCTANVPNPLGEDYIRYEPRLQSPPSGKASIRLRMREWLDHLLFIGYDLDVKKDAKDKTGKARGGETRTIYPCEMPHCMAKSRILSEPFVLGNPWDLKRYDTAVWDALFGAPAASPTEQGA